MRSKGSNDVVWKCCSALLSCLSTVFSGRHPPTLVVKWAIASLLWAYSPQSKDPKENSKPFLKKHFQQKPGHWFQLVQVGHKPVPKPITAPRTRALIAHIPVRTSSLKHMGGGMWIVHEMRGLQWVGLDFLKREQLLLKEVSCASKTSDHFEASKGFPPSKLYHS